MSQVATIEKLVQGIISDDQAIKARCELALQLARKLDDAVSDQAQAASYAATAQLSKELRAVIDELSSVETKKQHLVAGLFAADESA